MKALLRWLNGDREFIVLLPKHLRENGKPVATLMHEPSGATFWLDYLKYEQGLVVYDEVRDGKICP